ncbi:MAG TPA: site-2 protease family protein [Candidatus Aquilonibacter sp.]|nr:site-2 protease family protein [Candidatus Aquilonibacter sp.]
MPLTFALVIFELVVMVLSISLHDSAQAWMANRLGDPTARMMGRISMNPAKHFDWLGMVIFPVLFIFQSPLVLGWGKPITMTPRNFRNPSRDEMVATLAGPGVQLLAAIVALLVLVILRYVQSGATLSLVIASQLAQRNLAVPMNNLPGIFPLYLFLYFCILVNLLLFVFNLIPLPFLDGGKILMHYLPYNAAKTFQSLSMWLMIGFFFLGFYVIMIFFAPLMTIFNTMLFKL